MEESDTRPEALRSWRKIIASTIEGGKIRAYIASNDERHLGRPNGYTECVAIYTDVRSFVNASGVTRAESWGLSVFIDLDGRNFTKITRSAAVEKFERLKPAMGIGF